MWSTPSLCLMCDPFLLCVSGKQTEKEGGATSYQNKTTSGQIVDDDESFLSKVKKKIFG